MNIELPPEIDVLRNSIVDVRCLEKGKAEMNRNSYKAGIPVETIAVISGFIVGEVQAILDA
ncbi:hypothetical protein FACS189438_1410 [Bacteroidia bacterium]|nr:hypothetical protein FACS189438_1410 [Bacteroidia bacterium]